MSFFFQFKKKDEIPWDNNTGGDGQQGAMDTRGQKHRGDRHKRTDNHIGVGKIGWTVTKGIGQTPKGGWTHGGGTETHGTDTQGEDRHTV